MADFENYLCCLKLRTCVALITIINRIYYTTFTVGVIFYFLKSISYENALQKIDYLKIMSAAGLILLTLLVHYVNINLMKATKKFNILYIRQWLMFHSIHFIIWTAVLVFLIIVLHSFNLSLLMFIQAVIFFILSYIEMDAVLQFYCKAKFIATSSTEEPLRVTFQKFDNEEIAEADETTDPEC